MSLKSLLLLRADKGMSIGEGVGFRRDMSVWDGLYGVLSLV
jgi:hypothetical protein